MYVITLSRFINDMYMKRISFLLCLFSFVLCPNAFAQTTYFLPITGSNEITEAEYTDKYGQIYNITQPRLDIYLSNAESRTANGATLLLAMPGGAYQYVSAENEGANAAAWFNERGIAVAVLKYRQPNGHAHIPLTDAKAALQFIHEHKAEWGIEHVGVIGFSAGGHLAASLLCDVGKSETANNEQRKANGLDFGILVYPVLSMEDAITHAKTKRLLLGENPTEEQVARWTLKNEVTEDLPPVFITACQDDKAVPIQNSLEFYQALTNHKVLTQMLIFPKGGHGWGFTRSFPQREIMEKSLLDWIIANTQK